MSFSQTCTRLRRGNTSNLHARPEMSAHEEEIAVEAEIVANEKADRTSTGFSPDMIEEIIKANFESFHAQISALTEMMDRLIQGKSSREFTRASTNEFGLQFE